MLVDMYLPVKRKDLFNGSWFEIAALLETQMFHGVVLQGDALKLASALEEMIANENVQTKFLEDSEKQEVSYVSIFVVPSLQTAFLVGYPLTEVCFPFCFPV